MDQPTGRISGNLRHSRPRKRRRATDPRVVRRVHDLATGDPPLTPSQILTDLERSELAHLAPSERTIRKLAREAEEESDDRWSFSDPAMAPEDARLCMEVVAAAAMGRLVGVTRRRGEPWPLSRSQAAWFVRVRRAFPELSLAEALAFARQYDREPSERHRQIDDELARSIFGKEGSA
jgi:hypothetical protein